MGRHCLLTVMQTPTRFVMKRCRKVVKVIGSFRLLFAEDERCGWLKVTGSNAVIFSNDALTTGDSRKK